MATFRTFMEAVFNNCITKFSPAFFESREELGTIIEGITESTPIAALDCYFVGSLVPTANNKFYDRASFNIFLCAMPNDDTSASKEYSRGLLHVMAREIAQKVREQAAWYLVPTNSFEALTPSIQYFANQFDERCVVLSLTLDLTLDLGIKPFCQDV